MYLFEILSDGGSGRRGGRGRDKWLQQPCWFTPSQKAEASFCFPTWGGGGGLGPKYLSHDAVSVFPNALERNWISNRIPWTWNAFSSLQPWVFMMMRLCSAKCVLNEFHHCANNLTCAQLFMYISQKDTSKIKHSTFSVSCGTTIIYDALVLKAVAMNDHETEVNTEDNYRYNSLDQIWKHQISSSVTYRVLCITKHASETNGDFLCLNFIQKLCSRSPIMSILSLHWLDYTSSRCC